MTIRNSFASKAVVALVAFAMMFSLALPAAQAQTVEELQAQINALLAQIASLQGSLGGGGSTSGVCPYTWTRSLSQGSSGTDVMKLQQFLNSDAETRVAATGVGSAGQETQFYGALTAAAVSKFQSKYFTDVLAPLGLVTPTGFFGQSSITKANALCATGGGTTGGGTTGGTTGGTLSGGAGSVSEYKKSSEWVNEEVGEEEDDVTVVGLEIEADDNSDLQVLALKVDFDDEGTANNSADLDKYVDNVSVWFDGEKVAELDASEFDDDNNYGKTLTLDSGVVVEAGERITVEVAVTGITNLDSSDAGDSWNVDIESVRWKDGQGTVISEDPSISETKFTLETFATATDVEFKIKGNDRDDINDAHIIDVDATNATDNVEVFSFDVEIKGNSDVFVDDLTVEATVTGAAQLDEMVDQLHLYMDGDKVDSVTVPTDEETVTFDDLDLDLEAGETYEFVVAVDFLGISGALDEGDTLSFTIGETETDLGTASTDIRDENGDQLADADKTGSASSDAHATHDIFIELELVGTPTIEVLADGQGGTDDDRVTMTVEFDITARGGTVYVGDTSAATTFADGSAGGQAITDAIIYRVFDSGTATTDDLTADLNISYTDPLVTDSTDNIQIDEGGTSRVRLTVTQVSDTAEDDGIYRMDLAAIYWGVADDTTYEFGYTYDLDDFETPSAFAD